MSKFDSGREQRRMKALQAVYDVELKYTTLKATEIQVLWSFYQARRGKWESFNIYDPLQAQWSNVYVGQGDGSSTIFDIPGKTTYSQEIYLDGVLQTGGYSILTGGGLDNADRVSFANAPAINQIITCGFVGMLRIHCRFAEDIMERELFTVALYQTGLKLHGLPI